VNEQLLFFLPPFAMCILLVGIHCYLGLHVLARGVIFVDLSLAQVATLGATVGLLLDYEHSATATYFISLCCTFVAAALFAWGRRFEKYFPQEAIIGIVFALSSAAVILVVDRTAHGAEHIKDSLVGHLLWVSWNDVIRTGLIYSAVGILHYIFRGPLLAASFAYGDERLPKVKNAVWWDFMFYALFGFVITSSTSVAGVLLVFSFLIVPSVVGQVFFTSLRGRLFFGWTLGAILCFVGLVASFRWDLPAGALMVALFGLVPVVLMIFAPLLPLKRR
jgi:zinc/manganese transport system permease protein